MVLQEEGTVFFILFLEPLPREVSREGTGCVRQGQEARQRARGPAARTRWDELCQELELREHETFESRRLCPGGLGRVKQL